MFDCKILRMEKFVDVKVRVDRTCSPQQMLDALGYEQLIGGHVVLDEMPRGEGEEVDIHLFSPGRDIANDDDREIEYARRGLKSADPYSLLAIVKANPDFLVWGGCNHIVTYYKDGGSRLCHVLVFKRITGERAVDVEIYERGWSRTCWFAGIRNGAG